MVTLLALLQDLFYIKLESTWESVRSFALLETRTLPLANKKKSANSLNSWTFTSEVKDLSPPTNVRLKVMTNKV